MQPSVGESSSAPAESSQRPGEVLWTTLPEADQRRNWLLLAAHLAALRIGWVFKTESVIIPAFVDALSGAGWLRGAVPLVTRLGHSIPPTLVARRLKNLGRKKWALWGAMTAMGLLAWSWALTWWLVGGQTRWWLPAWFVAMYALFSSSAGVHQLAFGTVQGKLIRTTWRGRLFSVSIVAGVIPAVLCALWLMDSWRQLPDGGFTRLFLFCGGAFLAGSLLVLAMVEPADSHAEPPRPWTSYFRESWQVLCRDRPFALLCLVAALFGTVPILFPHYQALGRERLGLGGRYHTQWIVMQNIALGLSSLLAGVVADRRGNRLALRLLIFGTALTPLVAVGLSRLEPAVAGRWFWIVFAPLALTPLTTKTLVNYALEFCSPANHPRYLSTLNLCQAVPFLLSPAVGWLVDVTSFEVVLTVGALVILGTGGLTFWLREPRHGWQAVD